MLVTDVDQGESDDGDYDLGVCSLEKDSCNILREKAEVVVLVFYLIRL